MKLFLDRKWKKDTYTIGIMYIDGKRFSDTIEDRDRGLKDSMSESEIKLKKIYGKTAIPSGTYNIRMDIVSPKYSMKPWYVKNCNGGKMPRLEKVPGYEGVLIHPGNTPEDTNGCILVGRNTVKGQVTNSKDTFLELYKKMYSAYRKGEKITLTIK
jgi:hypothetical protein